MNTDNTYQLMTIINCFNRAIKNVDRYSKEYDNIEEKYAQAIRIQCYESIGDVFVKEDFTNYVETGSFIDYDGNGCFATFDGEKKEDIKCDKKFLDKYDYPFIIWYNK